MVQKSFWNLIVTFSLLFCKRVLIESNPLLSIQTQLKVMAQAINFWEHKVHITFLNCLIRYDRSEEVWKLSKRLVADHDCTSSHHTAFDLSSDFSQFSHPITCSVLWKISWLKTLRNIPKTDVGAFWLALEDKIEFFGLLLHASNLIGCQIHQAIDLLLKAFHSPWTLLKP